MKTILVLGPHPDDLEISVGGTLAKWVYQNKYMVVAAILSEGEKGGNPKVRLKETKEGLKCLGVHKVFFGDFKDTEIPESYETISFIEALVKLFNPDVVLIPSNKDTHQDHRAVHNCALSACRKVPTLLAYETASIMPDFKPNFFVDISNYTSVKKQAIQKHTSQAKRDYMDFAAVENLSFFRGRQIGVRNAEAFEVIRMKGD